MENKDLSSTENSFESLLKRYNELIKESQLLSREINEIRERGVTTDLQPQMNALHEYNEMKDLTQIVLGYLAEIEKVTLVELHQRYGLPLE